MEALTQLSTRLKERIEAFWQQAEALTQLTNARIDAAEGRVRKALYGLFAALIVVAVLVLIA
jgi:hypothetical protein